MEEAGVDAIAGEKVEMVALGRVYIADSEFSNKVKEGIKEGVKTGKYRRHD